ncbi:inositol monophosphatase [Aldersonia sp. NBC_00410]|uniref:inositol monophosphatase family protein n=1 Tax=Aldersonia sp. NBC_00410 TaxID=2975954 RepID=UPI0022575A5F|nr:inositol monophosphatase family protein [Aldersonia sp. NBC_00410]MCX5042567.1 inositol monophosphatase [Aldersonia sp. NBC_00410]
MRPTTDTAPSQTTDPYVLRAVAVQVATEAADHIRRRRPQVFGPSESAGAVAGPAAVQAKSTATDPVTVVDTEAEQLIRRRLEQLRPGDAVLGEEEGGSASVDGVLWVVDPIDGTVNFLYGIPAYSVSVAAQIDGRSVAGAVIDVAAGVLYSAARGHGATRTDAAGVDVALRCRPVDTVGMALVATGFGYAAGRRAVQGDLVAQLLPRVRDIRRIGSAALDLCMVATGLVDAHYEHGLNAWDWAAGALIAAEAGARIVVPDPTSPGAVGEIVVACAPGIADEFLMILGEVGALNAIPAHR